MINRILNKLDIISEKARPNVPFTILNTVRRNLDGKVVSILDVACGKAEPMKSINMNRQYKVTGVDVFQPYLKICDDSGLYSNLIRADIRNLPIKPDSFDVVLCMEALEHLEKEEGEELLLSMESIAIKQVIFSTPVGKFKQTEYDKNPNQEHKYIWEPAEIKRRGYKVRGAGIRGMGGKSSPQSPFPRFIRLGVIILWILLSPITYFLPRFAGGMIGIKYVN